MHSSASSGVTRGGASAAPTKTIGADMTRRTFCRLIVAAAICLTNPNDKEPVL